MKRRQFIISSIAGATLPFWLRQCTWRDSKIDFPVYIQNDQHSGHMVLASNNWPEQKIDKVETLIVGGGLAGLTAAHQLKQSSFALYELSGSLGGSSASAVYGDLRFSQGAHYDLEYPDNYGSEGLKLLESLNIIKYASWKKSWAFVDEQHLIPPFRRQQCYDHGVFRDDVLPTGKIKNQFIELMSSFSGQMVLPTPNIDQSLYYLNDITFDSFLKNEIDDIRPFLRYIDYHMKDDWGGSCSQVSALAGIHYFACRPYYTQHVPLFSPPEGNDYFAQRLLNRSDKESFFSNHLVSNISKEGNEYLVTILDLARQQKLIQKADQVIYAGQKHTLKYVFPGQETLFDFEQAPWMIVNFTCDQVPNEFGFWQNEYLGANESFLGFIDSSVQSQSSLNNQRVYTCYYCLKPSDKQYLADIADHQNSIVNETLGYLHEILPEQIQPSSAHIKVMGHAMPIPKPNYLLNDANDSPQAEMIYAGVDNGRLPLLFEAIDSGIQAVNQLK